MQTDEAASPSWADRGWYLALEFRQSSSPRFERAVAAASKHPGFALLIDESGTCVYRTLYRPDQLAALPRLLPLVSGWKETRCYIRGEEVDPATVDLWLACYLARLRQPDPPCRRPLRASGADAPVGCYFAGISLRLSDWDGWYRHGALDARGVFHVNKEELRYRLASWQRQYRHCPFADEELLRRVVDHLPDEIDPHTDTRWVVTHHAYFSTPMLAPRSPASYQAFLQECLAPLLTQG